jgi:putative transposase
MRQRKTIRIRGFDYVGEYRCAFTLCTCSRQRLFTSNTVVDAVLLQFQQCADRERIGVAAYCFMPDHLHLLTIGLTPASDTWRFIKAAKQASGFWHSRRKGGLLWQRYVWDRVLRSQEDTMGAVRYILANPVRAGLVREPLEYPFSGSMMFPRETLVDAFRDVGSR